VFKSLLVFASPDTTHQKSTSLSPVLNTLDEMFKVVWLFVMFTQTGLPDFLFSFTLTDSAVCIMVLIFSHVPTYGIQEL
jgi:hypothetical protein